MLCPSRMDVLGQAVSWGTQSHGHQGMPSEGSPGLTWMALCSEPGGTGCPAPEAPSTGNGLLGRGPAPLRAGTSVPVYSGPQGPAGSPSWQSASPCLEAPAQACRQDQGLALCTLCLALIKHHGLRSPSCGSRDKRLGQNSSQLFRAQRFFGQAEPWESAAEPGHCSLPRTVSCLRTPHGMGAVGSKSLPEAVGTTAKLLPSTYILSPALLLHLASYAHPMLRTTRVLCGQVWRTPDLCWIWCWFSPVLYPLVHTTLHACVP